MLRAPLLIALFVTSVGCGREEARPVPVEVPVAVPAATEAPPSPFDASKLVGDWRIRHTIHETDGVAGDPAPPLVPTVWTFGEDGSFSSPALQGRYSLRGDALTLPSGGEPYTVAHLDDARLEVTFKLEAGSVLIRNTTVLDRVTTEVAAAPAVPDREMTEPEKAMVGTWIATTSKDASTSKMMDSGALLALTGGDPVAAVMDAVEKNQRIPTNCIWFELRADFTGQRCVCALMSGEPQLLETTNITTGAKSPLGAPLTWQATDGKTLEVVLSEPHVVPRTVDGALTKLDFVRWQLKVAAAKEGTVQVEESFPEHGFALEAPQTYEVFPGQFLSGS